MRDTVEVSRPPVFERLLRVAGLPAHEARLVAVASAFRGVWLGWRRRYRGGLIGGLARDTCVVWQCSTSAPWHANIARPDTTRYATGAD